MRERPALRVALLALVLAGALGCVAACAGVPSSGPVLEGRPVPQAPGLDEPDIRVLPPAPRSGDTPEETVRGFLVAAANFEDRHAIARRYLTPRLRDQWDSEAGVAVYDVAGLSLSVAPDGGVTATAPMQGTISRLGEYAVAPRGAQLRDTFRLSRVEGQWRIAALPPGLWLTRADVDRAYRAVTVYFLDPTRRVLVPDARFLPVRLSGLSTALVRALLAGPAPWLAPAVRTAVPAGTQLLTTAPVHNGVVTVDLSGEVGAAPDLRALSAQLVWTLGQLPDVHGVRLLAEGAPLPVPGAGRIASRSDVASYDPTALAAAAGFYVRDGRLLDRAGTPVAGPVGSRRLPLESVALAPAQDLVAGLRPGGGGVTLYAGSLAAGPQPRRSAAAFTPPSWDRTGNLWTVQDGRLVVLAGGERAVPALAPELEGATVRALRVSPDATRVAAVLVRGGTSALVVGRIVVAPGRLRAEAFRPAAPGLVDVRDVAWAGENRLAVLARGDGETMAAEVVEADGSQITPVPTEGLAFSRLAAAPGRPLLACAGDQIWEHAGSRWRPIGRGSDPLYPG